MARSSSSPGRVADSDMLVHRSTKYQVNVCVCSKITHTSSQAISKSFLLACAKGVVLVGRSADKLEAAAADLPAQLQDRVLTVAGNIASQEFADSAIKQAVSKFGQVDVLVNAAGAMNVGPVDKLESSDWWENFVSTAFDMSRGPWLNI